LASFVEIFYDRVAHDSYTSKMSGLNKYAAMQHLLQCNISQCQSHVKRYIKIYSNQSLDPHNQILSIFNNKLCNFLRDFSAPQPISKGRFGQILNDIV